MLGFRLKIVITSGSGLDTCMRCLGQGSRECITSVKAFEGGAAYVKECSTVTVRVRACIMSMEGPYKDRNTSVCCVVGATLLQNTNALSARRFF